jgi:hypothetical protein
MSLWFQARQNRLVSFLATVNGRWGVGRKDRLLMIRLRNRRMVWYYGFPELLDVEKVQEGE